MHPLVARIARAVGRGGDEERRFDVDKAYWTRLEAEREASPAFRQAMDDDPSFMYVDYPGESSPAWDAYMASLDGSADVGSARVADQRESPLCDTGWER